MIMENIQTFICSKSFIVYDGSMHFPLDLSLLHDLGLNNVYNT